MTDFQKGFHTQEKINSITQDNGYLTNSNGENEDETGNIFNMVFQDDKQFQENFFTKKEEEKLLKEKQIDLESEEQPPRKSLFQRYFSKMDEGSLRGSIFAMSSIALGTGCLALPQKFGQMSFLCALLVLVFAACASYWSLKIMIIASKKINCDEYSKCVSQSFGKKASNFLDIVTIIYIFGILVSYQVISN